MLTADEAVRRIADTNAARSRDAASASADGEKTDRVLSTVAAFLDELSATLTETTQPVRVLNHPKVQRIEGPVEVTNLSEIADAVAKVAESVEAKETEFPAVQRIEGTVTVENQVQIPSVKIPPYPKRVESAVVSLPKYVGESLDALLRAVRAIEVRPEVTVETAAPLVTVDLEAVAAKLDEVARAVRESAYVPEPPDDFSEVLGALDAVRKAVVDKPIPVATFPAMPRADSGALAVTIVAEDSGSPGTYRPVMGGYDADGRFVLLTSGSGGGSTAPPADSYYASLWGLLANVNS